MGVNTWMSPVQARRSSRCGQSVGMSTKFERRLHTTFSWSRSSSGSLERNQPVRCMSLCRTRETTAPSASSPGQPLTSAKRYPWMVKRGSHRIASPVLSSSSVAAASRRVRVYSSPSWSTSACRTRISWPGSAAGTCRRRRPEWFWPKSSR